MVTFEWRTGFGFDIEANDLNCMLIRTDEKEATVLQFNGLIILLPFLKIHIGSFIDLFEDFEID